MRTSEQRCGNSNIIEVVVCSRAQDQSVLAKQFSEKETQEIDDVTSSEIIWLSFLAFLNAYKLYTQS